MRRLIFNLIFIATGLLAASVVFAVGGGSGGSVPSCSADQWDCTGWSQCGPDGTQTRICALTYDCSTIATPKPTETQTCVPSAPPVEPEKPQEEDKQPEAPAETKPEVKTEPKVEPEQKAKSEPKIKTPPCAKDVWTCGVWSENCDIYGREHRTCALSFDCPNVQTPPPFESQMCQKVQCGNKLNLRDRISCRLNLAPAGAARDLELKYLPEACRMETGDEQKECIDRYKSFQPCWNLKEGEERFSCAKNALKLGPIVAEEVKKCQGRKSSEQVSCKAEIRERVLYMIAFRFYDLETRAEELGNRGADLEAIADFETIVELKKQAFEAAATNAERKQIILDVRRVWQKFVNEVKNQVE